MLEIDDSGSTFPTTIHNFGNVWNNDACERMMSADLNLISHAMLSLEQRTRNLLLAGDGTNLTPATTGTNRPASLLKVYSVAVTGSAAETKTATLSGFSSDEKTLFGGYPLASGTTLMMSARRADQGSINALHGFLACPKAVTDYSGDSGWDVILAPQLDSAGGTEITVSSGTYYVTVWLLRTGL